MPESSLGEPPERNISPQSIQGQWVIATSSLVLLLSLSVLFGWWLQLRPLVQMNPEMASMKFNTALCLALEAAIFLSFFRRASYWKALRRGAALAVLAIAGLTGLEYLLDVSFGIDELFVADRFPSRTSHAGRMSPITSVCHVLMGAYLLVESLPARPYTAKAKIFLPPPVFALSCIALMGYAMDIEAAYAWGDFTQIALRTAIAFFLLSTSGISLTLFEVGRAKRIQEIWRLAPFILGGWCLIAMVGITLATHERKSRSSQTQMAGALIQQASQKQFAATLRALDRFAERQARRAAAGSGIDSLDLRSQFQDFPQLRWAHSTEGRGDWHAPGEASPVRAPRVPDDSSRTEDSAWTHVSGTFVFGMDVMGFVPGTADTGLGWIAIRQFPAGKAPPQAEMQYRFSLGDRLVFLDFSATSRFRMVRDKRLYFLTGLVLVVLGLFTLMAIRAAVLSDLRAEALAEANGKLEANARELSRSNTDLEQFVFVASHDLQTPLRHIGGFTQLLLNRPDFPADREAREYGGRIMDGVTRMQDLISGLLEISRLEKSSSSPVSVDLRQVLIRTERNLAAEMAQAKGALELPEDLPQVKGNALRLSQLFDNILQNSIKYRNPEKPLRVRVSARHTGPWLVVKVEDNGMGVKPVFREKAFKLFQRLPNGPGIAGTGIGLTLCKRIVEQHGGEITLEDSELGGVAVVIRFPETP